jgi:hypothetical protein
MTMTMLAQDDIDAINAANNIGISDTDENGVQTMLDDIGVSMLTVYIGRFDNGDDGGTFEIDITDLGNLKATFTPHAFTNPNGG